ncbi:exo-alpha-sialidase [Candidatus Nitronereus thalassa]|uniref:Exo-alpha-sialidase n=1 Tax=Candidatus Nitronereus thalassa TaxID=3020898 RepID=A0ABU3K603_9BACT|nr:exo-alpha-sialidase [Candidatus Nitronereus thalassa]MDT7041839.1 exo-alpha-sialidase [Candidatus Nitronereus thalassa]
MNEEALVQEEMDLKRNRQHVVIAQNPNRHLAFPDVCQLISGEILVVYREGAEHVDASGRLMMCRSVTPGNTETFSAPKVICDTDWDDRDPSIVQLSNGIVLVNFFRMNVSQNKLCLTIVKSLDGGETWEAPQDINVSGFSNGLATTDAVLELPSGELLMPLYGCSDQGANGSYLLRSQDGGHSWPVIGPLAVSGNPIFEEPALMRLQDGRLLSFLRTDHKGRGYVYQTISEDEGVTWNVPERLPLWGYPADLLMLSRGGVLATYGYRQLPAGIRCCRSQSGLSWSIFDEQVLRADGHDDGELGYPSSIELSNGEILTVYYFSDRGGGAPYIAGTRYQLT